MKEYQCENCGKKFDKKYNYNVHINRVNPCDSLQLPKKILNDIKDEEIIESNIILKHATNITNENIKKCLNENKCAYCDKKFSNKNNTIYHIKNSCKKVREIENEKHEIFTRLKENKKIQEEKDRLHEEKERIEIDKKKFSEEKEKFNDKKTIEELKVQNKKIDEQNKLILSMFNKLQKEFKKSKYTKNIDNSKNTQNIKNNQVNNNSNNNNNTFNQQNINLVGYKQEDLDKLDKSEILAIMKRGFQAPVELTRTIHFNPKYPEFHNIYIPKINEKYGMVYTNNKWRLIDKNELVEDIYENKRDFIIQNLDNFINQLDEFKKKSLKRWLNTDENDDESVINTKNDIKMLLFDNRHLAMDKKRIMDREARKLEIVSLPKKVKSPRQICNIEVKNVLGSDNDSTSDSDSENSDSTQYSNYSYMKSEDEKI
jgi:hypothetical protein